MSGKHEKPTTPPKVAVVRIASDSDAPLSRYSGQIKARYEVNVAFRVGGKVTERYVDIGQRISAGTKLAQLDSLDYRLQLEAAESELVAAKAIEKRAVAEEKRSRDLVARSMVSLSEYDLLKSTADSSIAAVRRAERMLELAKNRLSYCSLVAEHDSVVTRVLCERGSVVAEGQQVFQLSRLDELEVVVDIPENKIGELASKSARMSVWGEPESDQPVKLRELSPSADPVTRTYQAKFAIPTVKEETRLGRTAILHLENSEGRSRVSIPLSSIFESDGRQAVWIVDSARRLQIRPIELHSYGQNCAWVASGLEEGELIVRAGVQKLEESMEVMLWEDIALTRK